MEAGEANDTSETVKLVSAVYSKANTESESAIPLRRLSTKTTCPVLLFYSL